MTLVIFSFFFQLVEIFAKSRADEYFYASLYAGLYYESQPNSYYLHIFFGYHSLIWLSDSFCLRSDDYMAALAKVHCLCRDWSIS
ncbi:hypothetical protein BHE74_00020739 [Ensete ventricosum]|nr:hypothetical protein GW17_00027033 [Ensete ventricosum]RWW71515.1 hypothetical protein BHE74_00020739 [Ensete ventricosum]RZS04576.1 hypothetical protein BHM03_00034930 [Ensete ventricosum]